MGMVELFMIAIGLSMDAFAVSLGKGLNMVKLNYRNGLVIAIFFGGFQALMPLVGWSLGRQFEQYITSLDHWIAFFLLAVIGGKMFLEGIKCEDDLWFEIDDRLDIKEVLVLAVATSIDALAVGITFAFLDLAILSPVLVIGTTTFALSMLGVVIGNRFGIKYKGKAEIAGGMVLILIGFKILFEHLNIL